MDKTDEELIKEGIVNIELATKMVNENLQQREKTIEISYNDEILRKKRNKAFEVLEEYLFQKKVNKQ